MGGFSLAFVIAQYWDLVIIQLKFYFDFPRILESILIYLALVFTNSYRADRLIKMSR